MGTDIHLYVEVSDEDGNWQEIKRPYTGDWYGPVSGWSPWWDDEAKNLPDPTGRNYNLFAFLADVRNGSGFAGVPTHTPVTPQFPRRGIPDNISYLEPIYDEDGDQIAGSSWLGDHSFTWATLDELLALDWSVEFASTGLVGPEEYSRYKEQGMPESWSGGVWGQGIKIWDDQAAWDAAHEEGVLTANDYIRVYWKWKPLVDCDFKRWCEGFLLSLSPDHPERVRVTMGFDS